MFKRHQGSLIVMAFLHEMDYKSCGQRSPAIHGMGGRLLKPVYTYFRSYLMVWEWFGIHNRFSNEYHG